MKFSDMCNNTHLFMRTAALLDIDVRLRDVVKNEYEYESQLDGEWTAMEGGPTAASGQCDADSDAGCSGRRRGSGSSPWPAAGGTAPFRWRQRWPSVS